MCFGSFISPGTTSLLMPGAYQTFLSWQGMEGAQKLLRKLTGDEVGVHAVLLYGRPGSGRTTLAKAFAQLWMCAKPTAEGPCGECGVCKSLEAGRSVDMQWVEPWGLQGIIKRSSVTEVNKGDADAYKGVPCRTFFRTRPLMARHKVMIFEEVEKMNGEAANALLKTLEEPEPHAKLILTTSELGRVLPTLRSRCLAVACPTSAAESAHPFADSMGEMEMIAACPEPYDNLLKALEQHFDRLPLAALALGAAARSAADGLAERTDLNLRQAHAEVIRCVATWARKERPERASFLQAASLMHRALLQNGSAAIGFDYLFASCEPQ